MAKKRKCRYTKEELEIHEQAVRLRKMTDKQLVEAFRKAKKQKGSYDALTRLLDGLSAGECKGVGDSTVAKIKEYAQSHGLVSAQKENGGIVA